MVHSELPFGMFVKSFLLLLLSLCVFFLVLRVFLHLIVHITNIEASLQNSEVTVTLAAHLLAV